MARALSILIVLAIAASLLFGTHFYIAQRLVLDVGLPPPWGTIALATLALLGVGLFLQPIAERWIGPPRSRWLAWPASLWMGVVFYLLLLLGASDALIWLAGPPAAADVIHADVASSTAATRAGLILAIAVVVAAFGLRSGLRLPAVRRVDITLDRWPAALDGFRIVQISDLHIGPILGRSFASHVVSEVNRLAPDLVVVTGDLVDGKVGRLAHDVEPFQELHGRLGTYFVTGNHDHYSGADDWAAKAGALGMRVLRNERVALEDSGAVFDLAGVDDAHGRVMGGQGGEDLDRALDGRDTSRPIVLLAHDPSTFRRSPRFGVDLQLSGHTHGGQMWPFHYFVRLVVPFVAGLYRRGGSRLYVSRGTGFWGPPMRLFAPAEITEIKLHCA